MDMLSFFFFQAEDGIRDADVTGVQTCALPIYDGHRLAEIGEREPLHSGTGDRRQSLDGIIKSLLLIDIEAYVDAVDGRSFAQHPRQRIRIHHALNPEIILNQRSDGERHGSSLPLQEVDLHEIADLHPKELRQPARYGQSALRQHHWMEVDVDDPAEVCVGRPAADHHASFAALEPDTNRNLPIRLR